MSSGSKNVYQKVTDSMQSDKKADGNIVRNNAFSTPGNKKNNGNLQISKVQGKSGSGVDSKPYGGTGSKIEGQANSQERALVPLGEQQIENFVIDPPPRTYLMVSIFTCIFCFFPTGIFAVIFACKSKKFTEQNDSANAKKYSELARLFVMLSILGGLLTITGLIIYCILAFVVMVNNT